MKSLLFVKKIRSVFIVKKMILICQNIRSASWDVKKRFCDDKNSDLFCYMYKKKKVIFDDKNLDLFYYIFKNIYFLRRKLHS